MKYLNFEIKMEAKIQNMRFSEKLDEKYFCKMCNHVLLDTHQADCGCRYCSFCTSKLTNLSVCEICGEIWKEKVLRKDKAFQKEINQVITECTECNWSGTIPNYINHYNENHSRNICRYCQQKFDNENALNKHLEDLPNGTCKTRFHKCIYSEIGCNFHVSGDCQFKEHLKDDVNQHLEYVFSYIKDNNKKYSVAYMERQQTDLNKIANEVPLNNVSNSSIETKMIEKSNNIINVSPIDSHFTYENLMKEAIIKQNLLYAQLENARTNEIKLKSEVNELRKMLTLAQATIFSLEERLNQQEKVSYNGTFLWKITNVKEKLRDSKSGKQTSFYSPHFYSHYNGYKMCARVYLNGDGMGRGTHLSVFFVLMKGEYDSLLVWPFRQKVTFMLIDQSQSESRENIVDAFRPDPKSTSFIRPTTDMNVASGIPLFCSLTKFHSKDHEYIKDDTMFIKIIVDTHTLVDV